MPSGHDALEKCGEGLRALQIAQFFGIGRRNIDGGEINVIAGKAQHIGKVGGAVVAVLVGAEVQANRNARLGCLQPVRDDIGAVIVEAKAVDRRAILGQSEKPRFRVAGLRARASRRPTSMKPKPAAESGPMTSAFLSYPAAKSDRIGQFEPCQLGGQPL